AVLVDAAFVRAIDLDADDATLGADGHVEPRHLILDRQLSAVRLSVDEELDDLGTAVLLEARLAVRDVARPHAHGSDLGRGAEVDLQPLTPARRGGGAPRAAQRA